MSSAHRQHKDKISFSALKY